MINKLKRFFEREKPIEDMSIHELTNSMKRDADRILVTIIIWAIIMIGAIIWRSIV